MKMGQIIPFAEAAERLRSRRLNRTTSVDAETWHLHYPGGVDDLWIGNLALKPASIIPLH
jgi:hypothetical protein